MGEKLVFEADGWQGRGGAAFRDAMRETAKSLYPVEVAAEILRAALDDKARQAKALETNLARYHMQYADQSRQLAAVNAEIASLVDSPVVHFAAIEYLSTLSRRRVLETRSNMLKQAIAETCDAMIGIHKDSFSIEEEVASRLQSFTSVCSYAAETLRYADVGLIAAGASIVRQGADAVAPVVVPPVTGGALPGGKSDDRPPKKSGKGKKGGKQAPPVEPGPSTPIIVLVENIDTDGDGVPDTTISMDSAGVVTTTPFDGLSASSTGMVDVAFAAGVSAAFATGVISVPAGSSDTKDTSVAPVKPAKKSKPDSKVTKPAAPGSGSKSETPAAPGSGTGSDTKPGFTPSVDRLDDGSKPGSGVGSGIKGFTPSVDRLDDGSKPDSSTGAGAKDDCGPNNDSGTKDAGDKLGGKNSNNDSGTKDDGDKSGGINRNKDSGINRNNDSGTKKDGSPIHIPGQTV